LISLMLAAFSQHLMAQTTILRNCNVPAAQSFGYVGNSIMTATPNPLVLNAPRSVAINAGVLRALTNRGFYSQSVAPVGVYSPGITYSLPAVRTLSIPAVGFTPTTVLLQSQAYGVPTQPLSTTRVRLTLQTITGAEALNGIQSTANDACECSPEALRKLADRLACLRARLEKLEQGNGRVPGGNAGDDVDDLLRNVN
jgi:hypothetical protein